MIPARLRWACRRGMLELDILLSHFLEKSYASLSEKDQALFVKLLACEDQDLFEWFTGKKIPEDAEIKTMVDKVRHAKNSPQA